MLEHLTSTQILLGVGLMLGFSYAVVTALSGDVAPRNKSRRRQLPGSGVLDAIGLAHHDVASAVADIGTHSQPDFFRTDRRELAALHARSKAA